MTVREALYEGHQRLKNAPPEAGVDTPLLDASVLLAEALGTGREQVYVRYPDPLAADRLEVFRSLLERRLQGIPVSYLRGRKEFFGHSFLVGPAVLVPRPDTETLVEEAVRVSPPDASLHDMCTGSGCVAIAVSSERPDLRVSASDLSPDTLPVFRENSARILGRALPVYLSDLLAAVPGRHTVITANPPYLRDAEVAAMKRRGWPEPEVALAGGADGLDVVRRVVGGAPDSLEPGGCLLLEADPRQMDAIGALLAGRGFKAVRVVADLAGRGRVIAARWAP